MRTAIIDVGGGSRGIYAAGVLDFCLDYNLHFDYCLGVSAGSANLASFIGGQKGRNKLFYSEYAQRKDYMGLKNFIHKRSYIDMDYLYSTLSNSDGENPLNYSELMADTSKLYVIATNAFTGEAQYFTKEDMSQDHYGILKASCSIPGICAPYVIDGVPYFDGALSDPVPVEKAFSLGCDKVVLILTKPLASPLRSKKDKKIALLIKDSYPACYQKLLNRANLYNYWVEKSIRYQQAGRLFIVAPDCTDGVTTLSRNPTHLKHLYSRGLSDGKQIIRYLAQ